MKKPWRMSNIALTHRILKTERIVDLSYLVRERPALHIAIRPIWEGLAEHHWTDAQLRSCRRALRRTDFPGGYANRRCAPSAPREYDRGTC